MPIATRCPNCKAKLKGPDNLVGHTPKCPGCGTPVLIAADALVPPAAPGHVAANGTASQSAAISPVARAGTPQPSSPPKQAAEKKTTNQAKASLYDDLEIIDDLESVDETAKNPPARTAEAPRLAPVEGRKPPTPPDPKPSRKKPTASKPAERPPVFPNLDLDRVDPPVPAANKDEPLFPNLDLDQPDLPSSKAKAAPPPLLPNRDLERGEVPLRDDKEDKPLFPNMDLDRAEVPRQEERIDRLRHDMDNVTLRDDDDDDVPLTEVKDQEEVFDDYEVIEEGPAEEVQEIQELELVTEEEAVEVEAVEEDEVVEVEAVDDDLDDLEEIDDTAKDSEFSFKLLEPSVIFVQGQSGMFSINNAYDLLNGRTKKRLGEALEKKDDAAVVLRLFIGNSLVPTRIEVLEGRHRDLVLTVKRPPHLWTSKAEIFDGGDELLGSFEIHPFSTLMSKPVWISDHNNRKVAKMLASWGKGKCVYSTPDGKKLAETMSQAVYEQRIVLRWAPRGGSFYITFTKLAEKKRRHKLLLLGAVIGIDLFFTENRQGPIIGGGRR